MIVVGACSALRFLKVNNLKLVIRSHECVDGGIQWQQGRNLVTVFSASSYNGYCNKARLPAVPAN